MVDHNIQQVYQVALLKTEEMCRSILANKKNLIKELYSHKNQF